MLLLRRNIRIKLAGGSVTVQVIRRRMYESINYDGTSGPGSTD